jgi:pyruvate dehydrogenase E2 component (dihydrolipoamide acetyltransferase)
MAVAVVMPKQGQSVESCIIASWKKQPGDSVVEGETLCEVETDKALLEVESQTSGILLEHFFRVGDDVPVLTPIAAVGQPGDDIAALRPYGTRNQPEAKYVESSSQTLISPRARNLAEQKQINISEISGTGPEGRIIERDVLNALVTKPHITPLAQSMVNSGDFTLPEAGTARRITAKDLQPVTSMPLTLAEIPDEVTVIPLKGARKIIASRMLDSLQTTAQLTLNTSADARALIAYRKRLKASSDSLALQNVTMNDLVMYAVSRTLPHFAGLNALLKDEGIYQYRRVHLGFAVDTPRGLVVPLIRNADRLSLKQLSSEARRLADSCVEGRISPDELTGGTFTVSNLGSFGVESFTPVLNPPQVGILGVGNVNLKPVEVDEKVVFIPHIGLSLTVDHQAVDGAPAARFLQALSRQLAEFDLLLAL